MRRFRELIGLCTPGVSMSTIWPVGRFPLRSTLTIPWMRLRVVCGLRVTMASFSPTRAFNSVLLPAFGRPMMETNPERNAIRFEDKPCAHLLREQRKQKYCRKVLESFSRNYYLERARDPIQAGWADEPERSL